MKNVFRDFINTVYSRQFYKNIHSKSIRSILIYMIDVCLGVSIVAAVFMAILLVANTVGPSLVMTFILDLTSILVAIFIGMFLTWLIYGVILGILIMLISMVVRKRISYTISVKTALYALSFGMIFIAVRPLAVVPFLGEIITIVVILFNLKGIFPAVASD